MRVCIVLLLPALLVVVWFIPQIHTSASSFREADLICWERLWKAALERAEGMEPAEREEYLEIITSSASTKLSPQHELNMAALIVSTACFLLWVFSTPHSTPLEASLDLKLGTFYAAQVIGKLATSSLSAT